MVRPLTSLTLRVTQAKKSKPNFLCIIHSNILSRRLLWNSELKAAVNKLKDQVRYWSPASAAMWAVWGIVQAREDVEGNVVEPEFDYLGYSLNRFNGFRREIRKLGVSVALADDCHVLYLMLITDIFIVSHAYMYIVFPPNFFLYILHAHSHAE